MFLESRANQGRECLRKVGGDKALAEVRAAALVAEQPAEGGSAPDHLVAVVVTGGCAGAEDADNGLASARQGMTSGHQVRPDSYVSSREIHPQVALHAEGVLRGGATGSVIVYLSDAYLFWKLWRCFSQYAQNVRLRRVVGVDAVALATEYTAVIQQREGRLGAARINEEMGMS